MSRNQWSVSPSSIVGAGPGTVVRFYGNAGLTTNPRLLDNSGAASRGTLTFPVSGGPLVFQGPDDGTNTLFVVSGGQVTPVYAVSGLDAYKPPSRPGAQWFSTDTVVLWVGTSVGWASVAGAAAGVTSFNTRNGVVTLSTADAAAVGSTIIRKFPFTFATAGLVTGAALYTPTSGDLLLDAWLEIDTAWNGTTPKGDFGTFSGVHGALFDLVGAAVDMTNADAALANNSGLLASNLQNNFHNGTDAAGASVGIRWPMKFASADPIKVVVSTTGATSGADPGSTQGAAVLYLVTAHPV